MNIDTPAPSREGFLTTVGRYARLVKYKFVIDFLFTLVIVVTLLGIAGLTADGVPLTLLFFALGMLGVLSAVMTLDDVTGAEDGSDTANYVEVEDTTLRPLERKPLLTGELTITQARWFGYLSLTWGAVWWTLALLVTPHPTFGVTLLTALLLFLSVQYSWGLKFSYYGLGEAVLLFSAAAFLLVPYGLATGELPLVVVVQGSLFGFGQLLIAGYSNTNDIPGDAAAGRRTVAVLTSGFGNRVFLGVLTTINLLLVAVPPLTGAAPWWFVLVFAPFVVLRIRQYTGFLVTSDPLVARSRGIAAFRTVVACMVVFNLSHFFL